MVDALEVAMAEGRLVRDPFERSAVRPRTPLDDALGRDLIGPAPDLDLNFDSPRPADSLDEVDPGWLIPSQVLRRLSLSAVVAAGRSRRRNEARRP
jgi:hypothetical protein